MNGHRIAGYALHGSVVVEFNADWGLRRGSSRPETKQADGLAWSQSRDTIDGGTGTAVRTERG